MKWPQIKVAKVFNTEIVIDWTILLLLAVYLPTLGVLEGVKFFLILMTSVLMHELGHVLVAKKRGYKTSKINLNFFGGAAFIDFKNLKPKDEIPIALAGPAVSLLIAAAAYIPSLIFSSMHLSSTWILIIAANLAIGIFNLLPIFPMDGGRVLRAVGTKFTSNSKSTQFATAFGILLSAILFLLSIKIGYTQYIFLFIMFLSYVEYKSLKA